jgi:hypothetical protein
MNGSDDDTEVLNKFAFEVGSGYPPLYHKHFMHSQQQPQQSRVRRALFPCFMVLLTVTVIGLVVWDVWGADDEHEIMELMYNLKVDQGKQAHRITELERALTSIQSPKEEITVTVPG